MNIENQIKTITSESIEHLYQKVVPFDTIQVQLTRKDQIGDFTVVVFPLTKISGKKPEDTGNDLGNFLKEKMPQIASFETIKGFLNLTLSSQYWLTQLNNINSDIDFGFVKPTEDSPLVMLEFSSPNTNKPLHLGHIRNNLLGFSLARIIEANGNKVIKTNIVNDRGIHICKSMLAWQKWGNNETPETLRKKGDHLVGDFYVKFDTEYKKEITELQVKGLSAEEADKQSILMNAAREMLQKWEAGDNETLSLWKTMNQWVYDGFDKTYKSLGVDFDKIYYESQTFPFGRELVLQGVENGIFYRKEDDSVWADLSENGLDEKVLLRSDGTSVYITQDLGTAKLRYDEYPIDKMVYVVGNEQEYHFKVLALLLHKLGFKWGKELLHFSYGMVELPDGKMKSREGTVVDADDLMTEMFNTAREMSKELGKLEEYTAEQAETVYKTIALGALKYFILKVDPKKNITFNPKESIDFNGNTGPFIQYTFARICSIFRKAKEKDIIFDYNVLTDIELNEKETTILKSVSNFSNILNEAGKTYNPALIANYVYDLAKEYNQFYHDYPILFEGDEKTRNLRINISKAVGYVIRKAMWLLGIDVPERM
ncbi:MAG: arginine--tRNA ligase [Marinilabiliaceae bacterium]|nr:arginine--tRNA ligase [Marinilabiliaceae bacterium]